MKRWPIAAMVFLLAAPAVAQEPNIPVRLLSSPIAAEALLRDEVAMGFDPYIDAYADLRGDSGEIPLGWRTFLDKVRTGRLETAVYQIPTAAQARSHMRLSNLATTFCDVEVLLSPDVLNSIAPDQEVTNWHVSTRTGCKLIVTSQGRGEARRQSCDVNAVYSEEHGRKIIVSVKDCRELCTDPNGTTCTAESRHELLPWEEGLWWNANQEPSEHEILQVAHTICMHRGSYITDEACTVDMHRQRIMFRLEIPQGQAATECRKIADIAFVGRLFVQANWAAEIYAEGQSDLAAVCDLYSPDDGTIADTYARQVF